MPVRAHRESTSGCNRNTRRRACFRNASHPSLLERRAQAGAQAYELGQAQNPEGSVDHSGQMSGVLQCTCTLPTAEAVPTLDCQCWHASSLPSSTECQAQSLAAAQDGV